MPRSPARARRPAVRRPLLAPALALACLAFGWWCFDLIGRGGSIPSSRMDVRVLLSTERLGITSRATIACDDGLRLRAADVGEAAERTLGGSCEVLAEERAVAVEGFGRVARLLVASRGGAPLAIGGRRYRGTLELRSIDGRLAVWNVVPLESYLVGCIGGELPAGTSPLAALEAQAIASRTYAVHRTVNAPRFLYDDTRSQVYRGVDAEHPRVIEAVRATAGLVIRGRRPHFAAFYHSTCGGATSHGLDVFGDEGREHLPVRCEACAGSTHHRWTLELATDGAARLAEALGLGNRLERLEIAARDRTGRVERLTIEGNRARRSTRYAEVRAALRRVLGSSPRSSLWLATQLADDGALRIEGGGFGHGVGLCQVGAMELARRGHSARDILERYYPGTHLVSLP